MIGWLDCQAGVSGDMLLGALVDAGVPLEVLQAQVDRLGQAIRLTAQPSTRAGIGATKVDVTTGVAPSRTWSDVRLLLQRLDGPVRDQAEEVFRRLAEAEATIHRVPAEQVHFHEVGALDALADVVGVVAGIQHLGLDRLVCSPVALGSGTTRGAHGPLPVPAPAVLALLTGHPVYAGPSPFEAATPTGAALVATLCSSFGPLPAMAVDRVGAGAGTRDPGEVANLVRLVLGHETAGTGAESAVLLETNVDDLDPRLWPHVLQQLLTAGAADAWLTPILMKKGRPAHALSVLCTPAAAAVVRGVVFRETTSIGLREIRVAKHALSRDITTVDVGGQPVRIKNAWYDGKLVTSTPEWEDVAAAAAALGRPAKDVLEQAQTSAKKASTPSPPASGTPTQS